MKISFQINAVMIVAAAVCTLYGAGTMNTRGQYGVGRSLSPATLGETGLFTGGSFKIDFAREGVLRAGETERLTLLSQSYFLGYGISPFVDVNVELPFYQDFWDGFEEDRSGVGDINLGIKVQHPGFREDAPFRAGYFLGAVFPTGSGDRGYFQRYSYYVSNDSPVGNQAFTGEAFRLDPSMLWSLDMTRFSSPLPLRIYGNIGASVAIHTPDKNNLYEDYSAAVGALNIEYLATSLLSLYTELSGEFRIGNYAEGFSLRDINNDRAVLAFGAEAETPAGLVLGGSVDIGVSTGNHPVPWEKTSDAGDVVTYHTKPVPAVGLNITLGYRRRWEPRPADTVHTVIHDTVHTRDTIQKVLLDTVFVKGDQEALVNYEIITLPSVTFSSGSAELSTGATGVFDRIARVLNDHPEIRLEVSGYTDSTGSPERNLELSRQRAQSVADYLISEGIEATRLEVIGRGMENPVADNSTREGRIQNRRVEITRIDGPTDGE